MELRSKILSSDKLIEKIIGEPIQDYSISVGEYSILVTFSFKQWKIEITYKSVTVYTSYDETLITKNGLSNDEFFNMSLQKDMCVFLKEEHILSLRTYIKKAQQEYYKLTQLERL